MSALNSSSEIPWWKEPTREQWKAWIAAWLGWTLDAFDFTVFLLIMLPIAKEFDVPLAAVATVYHHSVAALGRRDGRRLDG
jgi:SHS family lactate transporter-like MFS transporter